MAGPGPGRIYQSILECPLAMLLAGSQRSRMLQLFADRNLITWGDLSCCPRGAARRWFPPALIEHLLTFASDTPRDCPPHSHPPPRVGQFWLLKGTAQDRGGIYRIDALPSPLCCPPLDWPGRAPMAPNATHWATDLRLRQTDAPPLGRTTGPILPLADLRGWRLGGPPYSHPRELLLGRQQSHGGGAASYLWPHARPGNRHRSLSSPSPPPLSPPTKAAPHS